MVIIIGASEVGGMSLKGSVGVQSHPSSFYLLLGYGVNGLAISHISATI